MSYTIPIPFRGTSQEDAESWIRHATWWLNTTRAGQSPNLIQRIHQIAVLLQDEGQRWFTRLVIRGDNMVRSGMGHQEEIEPDRVIESWEDFVKKFLERFKRDRTTRANDLAALIGTRQGINQTVEEFVYSIKRQGTLIGATESDMFLAVVTGLLDPIKAQVMQWNPTTIKDILTRGKIAERYPLIPGCSNISETEEVCNILRTMNLLEAKSAEANDRSRSVTANQVRFFGQGTAATSASIGRENPRIYQRNNQYSPIQFEQIQVENYSAPDSTNQGGFYERERMGTQNRSPSLTQTSGWQNRTRHTRGATNRYDSGPRTYRQLSEGCSSCGLDHNLDDRCPAINTTCFTCDKLNHWTQRCRDAETINTRLYRPQNSSEITYDSDSNSQ